MKAKLFQQISTKRSKESFQTKNKLNIIQFNRFNNVCLRIRTKMIKSKRRGVNLKEEKENNKLKNEDVLKQVHKLF